MTFLDQNYKLPDPKSGYMKFKNGANRFRILSSAIVGWEYWNTSNKPVRQKEEFDLMPEDIKLNPDGTYSQIKHFWVFIVWNYDLKMVQILEITQSSIQSQLKIKIDNREGKATENDFVVTRSGQGFDTEYDVDVLEASPVPPDAVMALKAKNINLEALFSGGDPFSSNGSASEPQNTGAGFEKFAEVVNNLPRPKQPTGVNSEPVAEDIANEAVRMEAEMSAEELAKDVPF